MNDLELYHRDKSKIEALEKENEEFKLEIGRLKRKMVREIKKQEKIHQKEITELKRRLRNQTKDKSKWRTKYENIKPNNKSKRLAKNQKALDMIAEREAGTLKISLVDIGMECGVNYGTLKHMAYEYRQLTST